MISVFATVRTDPDTGRLIIPAAAYEWFRSLGADMAKYQIDQPGKRTDAGAEKPAP